MSRRRPWLPGYSQEGDLSPQWCQAETLRPPVGSLDRTDRLLPSVPGVTEANQTLVIETCKRTGKRGLTGAILGHRFIADAPWLPCRRYAFPAPEHSWELGAPDIGHRWVTVRPMH